MNVTEPLDSPPVLGTWQLGGEAWGPVTVREAKALLERAWELGFRRFDSAERYGNGRSEQLIGQALRTVIRKEREAITIATKSEVRAPGPLTRHLERSLRRIGLEYLDIYYVHWPREGVDLRVAVEELERNRTRGLIRSIGLSNVTPEELALAATAGRIDALQLGYNLIWRRIEREFGGELFPAEETSESAPTDDAGRTDRPRLFAYSPLAQGLLAHPFPAEPERLPADHRRETPLFRTPVWPVVHAFASTVIDFARREGHLPAAIALAWVRSSGAVPIVGVRTKNQVENLVEGLSTLHTEPRDSLEALLAELSRRSDELQPHLPNLPNLFGYTPTPCDPPESEIHTWE